MLPFYDIYAVGKKKADLVTIKVTVDTVRNLKIASAFSGKTQYEVAEEGSYFVSGKYMSKQKKYSSWGKQS